MLPILFHITIDPMEKMLLVNFEKDPDSVYVGFEPQGFDDEVHGTGHIVLGWRVDGRVDVFHQPGITLDPDTYDIAGKGLAHMVEREMKGSYFYVNDTGVQAYFSFHDIEGRSIEIKIGEHNSRRRHPFSLLAPMGEAAENPSAIPLILLHDFYFVRRKKTEFRITIDGKSYCPDKFPMPLNGSMMYYSRYSPDPLIVTLNPAFDGEISLLEVGDESSIIWGDVTYEVEHGKGLPLLKSIQRKYRDHLVSIVFDPAFPNLLDDADRGRIQGSFVFRGSSSTGTVEGHYIVERVRDKIQVVMEPSRGWIPKPESLTIRFIYTVAGIFRNWPKSYRWTAAIEEKGSFHLYMRSSWERLTF